MADKPFVLLGVNSDLDREQLKQTLVKERINWRSWWDRTIQGPIHTKWQIEFRPAIHLLDADGVIRHRDIDAGEVDAAIEALLAELAKKREANAPVKQ